MRKNLAPETEMRAAVEQANFVYDFVDDWQIGIAKEHLRPANLYRMLCLRKRR